MRSREEFSNEVTQAADMGIAAVGGKKALAAALRTQHTLCLDLLRIISGVVERARAKNQEPVLPLTDEVLQVYNDAVGGLALVAELMKRDVLEVDRDLIQAEVSLEHVPCGRPN